MTERKNLLDILSIENNINFGRTKVTDYIQEDEIMDYDTFAPTMRAYSKFLDEDYKRESEQFKTLSVLLFMNKLSAWIGIPIYDHLKDSGIHLDLTSDGLELYSKLHHTMSGKTMEYYAMKNIFKIEDVDCSKFCSNLKTILDCIEFTLNSEMITDYNFFSNKLKDVYIFDNNNKVEKENQSGHYISSVRTEDKETSIKDLAKLKLILQAGDYLIKDTKRNELIERISCVKIKHLDKGYVKLINHMGDDSFAARFARSSYDKTDIINLAKDASLVNRLVRDRHTSPLEACQMAFEIKTCMMVRDQHVRHRMSSINIQSNRYTKHDGEYYVPRRSRIKKQSQTNKQGSGDVIESEIADNIIEKLMNESCDSAYLKYQKMLSYGVTRELARGILGSFFFSKISWTIDTHNLMHYLKLRNSEEAQEEIRELANIIEIYFELLFPLMYESYSENIKNAVTFSKSEVDILKNILSQFSSIGKKLGIK